MASLVPPAPVDLSVGDDGHHDAADGENHDNAHVSVEVTGFDPVTDLSIRRASSKLIPLTPTREGTDYCVIYHLAVMHGRKVLTLRSPLQVGCRVGLYLQITCKLFSHLFDVAN